MLSVAVAPLLIGTISMTFVSAISYNHCYETRNISTSNEAQKKTITTSNVSSAHPASEIISLSCAVSNRIGDLFVTNTAPIVVKSLQKVTFIAMIHKTLEETIT